jgi:PKD repeat protein
VLSLAARIVVSAFAVSVAMLTASAHASGPVVQQREPGDELIAHRYEAPAGTGPQKLTLVSRPAVDWTTLTLLDFDRDERPDGMVRAYWNSPTQRVIWSVWRLTPDAMAEPLAMGGGRRCLTPVDGETALRTGVAGQVALEKRSHSWAVTIEARFDQAFGELARFQPRMSTVASTAARAPGSEHAARDYLPNAAGPASGDTVCSGLVGRTYSAGLLLNPGRGTDRGQATAAATRRQAMPDRAGDVGAGEPDLLEAAIEQWDALESTGDVTLDAPPSTFRAVHPADLLLTFGPGGPAASATYLVGEGSDAPLGLVTTSPSDDAVDVELHSALAGLRGRRCYPRSGWGSEVLRVRLPLNERRTVRIPLDRVLGAPDAFRWVATTAPGALAEPDFAPDIAGEAAAQCKHEDADGTILDPARFVRMDTSLPSPSLQATPAEPVPGQPVTLTAAGGTGYRFDLRGSGLFDAADGRGERTDVYDRPATARVFVTDADGSGGMATVKISPGNPRPVAKFTALTEAPYVLDENGPTITWRDHSTDDGPLEREWTLTSPRQADPAHADGGEFTYTFAPGDHGDWTLRLKVTDEGGATDTITRTFRVVQPPVAIIEAHTQPHPATLGGDVRVLAQAAADGSLGSETPLRWEWKMDPLLPALGWNVWTVPWLEFRPQLAAVHSLQLRVRDADGRVSAPASLELPVRGQDELPPTARLTTSPAQPRSGETEVILDASASVVHNPDGSTEPATWFRYDFGDGTPIVTTGDPVVRHVYAGSGAYTAKVVAVDIRPGRPWVSDPATTLVEVVPGATDANVPVARLAGPAGTVYAQREVAFSAAETTVKSAPARYAWDFDGDGSFETDSGTQATAKTTYADAGVRQVRVRVTDGFGRQAASAPVTVDVRPAPDLPPHVELHGPDTVTLNGGSVVVPLDATGSTGRNGDPSLSYDWDLDGDGIYETATGATPTARAELLSRGERVLRVRAEDAFGNRAGASLRVLVRGAAEVAAGCTGREQYRTVAFGPVRAAACWTRVDRPNAGPLWLSRGNVAMNGLVLAPGRGAAARNVAFADCAGACAAANTAFNDERQGPRTALDPHDGKLVSNAAIAITAQGGGVDLRLSDAPLDLTLPARPSSDGLITKVPGGGSLLTFKVAPEAEIRFPEPGASTIGLSVHMPPQLPGASGDLKLRATESQGVIVDKLKVEVTAGLLAEQLRLSKLSLEYDRPGRLWAGSAELGLPGIKGKSLGLKVAVAVKDNRFKSIAGAVDGLNAHLGEGIFLQRIRASIGVDPVDISGGIGISAGPKIGGVQLLSSDGDVRVTFPSAAAPFTLFQISGKTEMLSMFPLTQGLLRFATNGFVELRGGISRQSFIGYFDATIGGWFTLDKVNLTGDAEAGLLLLGDKVPLVGARAVLSTKGMAACGEIPVIKLGGGMGMRWGQSFATFQGCDLGPYTEARPAGIPTTGQLAVAAAARVPTVRLAGGLRSAGMSIQGRGGAPRVRLVDEDGREVLTADREQLTERALVLFDEQRQTTEVLWKAPPKGRFAVLPVAGSAPVARVRQAVDAGRQRVRATVHGRGARRHVRWSVTPRLQPGQQLVLSEELPPGATLAGGASGGADGAAGAPITTTARSAGRAAFTPAEGHGEARVIRATILADGMPRGSQVAGRFSAPRSVVPARPARVSLRREGRRVTVAWAGRRPASWQVRARIGTGRTVLTRVASGRRTLTLADVPGAQPVTAVVQGVSAAGRVGASREAKLAAGAPRSGRRTTADARPRALRVRRSGRRLVVAWRAGADAVRGYQVTVRAGARTVRMHAHPERPHVVLRSLPRGVVRVEVRAERFGGGSSAAAIAIMRA